MGIFNWFNRNSQLVSWPVTTDMHSHLLPGIDDGAKDMDDSINLITGLMSLGYKKLITTPHINWEYYKNTSSIIIEKLDDVRSELKHRNIEIDINAAAEYFVDEHFLGLVEANDLLSFGDNYILIEQSFFAESPDLFDVCFRLLTKGYKPILAHPERYVYWGEQINKFEQLNDMGVQLQLNILSLSGQYGSQVKKLGHKLLENSLIQFLGTDLHHSGHIKKLNDMGNNQKVLRALQKSWKNQELNPNQSKKIA